MIIATEEQVRRYLDDLLVELEVSGGDAGLIKKIADTVNYYKEDYPHLLLEYKEKRNKIIEQFR